MAFSHFHCALYRSAHAAFPDKPFANLSASLSPRQSMLKVGFAVPALGKTPVLNT